MIDRVSELGADAGSASTTGNSSFMSAGDMLRQARESHGLELDVVAAALKVTPQKLAALEADNIEALPDAVFARALAASVCRALRVDPAPVLAKLPGAPRDGLADADRTISRSLRSTATRSGSGTTRLPSRPLLIVVGLLLIGAAALFWLPQSVFDNVGSAFGRMTGRSEASASSDASSASTAADGVVVEAVTPVAPVVAATPAPVVPAVVETPPPPADTVVLIASEDSWVTVNDGAAKPLLRRTVKAGETVGLSGTLPMSVVVGRASVVKVQVRGKPLDLAPLTRAGGVARFEVKP